MSHHVLASGQSDKENQLTQQKSDVNIQSNAHVVSLVITGNPQKGKLSG